jgi:hypothetical protein
MQVICDTGFEPVDMVQLMVKDIRFDETSVRMANIEREKLVACLKGFLTPKPLIF